MKTLRTFALAAALALAGCGGVSDEEWCAQFDVHAPHWFILSTLPCHPTKEWCERCGECYECCYGGRMDEFPQHCYEKDEQ